MTDATNAKVSVINPFYKGEKYIAQAIESVLAQTYDNFEIIIVNDGSPDDSIAGIRPYLHLPNVKLIEQENRGVAAARNAGIRNSSGEIVAFLDQDDWWLPDKLAVQVAHLAAHPENQLVHGYQSYAQENRQPVEFSGDWVADLHADCFGTLFQRNRIAILTVAVRRSCLDQVGLFNERISRADDYELWLRIARRFPLGFIDQPLGVYRLHGGNASRDSFAMELAELGAISAIVEQYPDTRRRIGAKRVHARLFELNFHVGNWYMWQAQDHGTAREYFKAALKHRPFHLASLGRFAWCSLTKPQRQACAWYVERARAMLGGSSK
jgi:glycosyltransferase involved in cell wall biosynthesis